MCYVYVIRCEDNSLYTGYTTDVERRINEHFTRDKKGAKYTKSHKIKKLEVLWECETKSVAMSLEYFIKKLKKQEKEKIIKNPDELDEISKGRFKDVVCGDSVLIEKFMKIVNTKKR